jgi:hypothetical protein
MLVNLKTYIEEQARAALYHGTHHDNVSNMLRKGKIEPSDESGRTSTTRSKHHVKDYHVHLKIDHDKLKHHSKIQPTDFHAGGSIGKSDASRHDDDTRDKEQRRSESEESVKGSISMKHVTHISVHQSVHEKHFRKIARDAAKHHPHIRVQRHGGRDPI